ncbi:hypothetical protein [Streptomyces sp. 184]|uniref:hypothetical protein n=1 Tax=Streptomyces sp. 184 TaxID=1827526 RepID=UPI00389239BE
MPEFEPLRPARGARLRRAVANRRRLLAALLAMAAAALAAAPRSDAEGPPPTAAPDGTESGVSGVATGSAAGDRGGGGSAGAVGGDVLAPVRIADSGVVGLLAPGDVVDVLAVGGEDGGPARVVARAARVAEIPGAATVSDAEHGAGAAGLTGWGDGLVVLSVPRSVAAALAGTAADEGLAVTLR